MATPLDKTLHVLASTSNVFAADLLVLGLDVAEESVRMAAVRTLLRRSSTRGQVEIIRRLPQFSPELRSEIHDGVGNMGAALRQCLIHGDNELRVNGFEFVRETHEYGQMSTLMEVLTSDRADAHDDAARTVHTLVDSLYEQLHPANSTPSPDLGKVRHKVLESLDSACAHFDSLAHAREVVEGVLVLGDPENFAVKRVLGKTVPACRQLAEEMLQNSCHPGIMQLTCDFVSRTYPHPAALEAISSRRDPEFIEHFLRWLPKRPSQRQQKALKEIGEIAWLSPEHLAIESIPIPLQTSLVSLASLSGLSSESKSQLREWMVRYGSPEGRAAAGDILLATDEASAQQVILSGLDADDPELQAWAVAQLRSQGIPEAFRLLIERLDSPVDAVREAARLELSDFRLETILDLFDQLQPNVCLRCGQLLEKIDPDIQGRLLRELANPIRKKRIRAAHAALALGLRHLVLPGLLAMLEDSDAHVRRTAVDILKNVREPQVVHAMGILTEDPSPRVRDAAIRALRDLRPAGQPTLTRSPDDVES